VTEAVEQPDLTIRPIASEGEVESCAHLMISSEPWITLGRTLPDACATLRDEHKESYLALAHDSSLAGFIIINMQGAFIGYIQTICLAPEWRGRGLGSRLIEFAEARIFRESPNVFICVSDFNTRARDLYLRLGYEIVGELKDYIVAGHAEILLRKTRGPWREFNR
jgi:[ribosomal protein S18]-alanine N-acetyltransferase